MWLSTRAPHSKNHFVPKVTGAEAEKPRETLIALIVTLLLTCHMSLVCGIEVLAFEV